MADTLIVKTALELVSRLRRGWVAGDFFLPPRASSVPPTITAARAFADESQLQNHEFFAVAASAPNLLRLWASQEAVVTGAFSQMLLLVASEIENVHLRATFLEVATGEHHVARDGVAAHSHPWLLYRLCSSVGLDVAAVQPLEATLTFLEALARTCERIPRALGALGVGNERMLLTEYTAVESCFDAALPTAEYKAFLRANVNEDETHCAIVEAVASAIAADGEEYYDGARLGVAARVRYYDDLMIHWRTIGLPASWLTSTVLNDRH